MRDFQETFNAFKKRVTTDVDIDNLIYEVIYFRYYTQNKRISPSKYQELTKRFCPDEGPGGHYSTYKTSALAEWEFQINEAYQTELK